MAHAASPITFMAVLPISNRRSIPATKATPSTGSPTLCSATASIIMPAPGTPAVPTEARVALSVKTTHWERVKFTPKHAAIKVTQTPWYMPVPSILTVAPNGMTKSATDSFAPKPCAQVKFSCMALTDEAVENASETAGSMFVTNRAGEMRCFEYKSGI